MGGLERIKSLVEELAGAAFTGTAAGCHAGAGLQLLERIRTFPDGLLEPGFRDSVTDTNVHGDLEADITGAETGMQMIRI